MKSLSLGASPQHDWKDKSKVKSFIEAVIEN